MPNEKRTIQEYRRRERKRKRNIMLVSVSIIVLLFVFVIYIFFQLDGKELGKGLSNQNINFNLDYKTQNSKNKVDIGQIESNQAILIDLKTGETLSEKNSKERIYPASLTKMMTLLVALENIPDKNKTISLEESLFYELYEQNASMAGFEAGEKVQINDLLYGIILPSGAECCLALANEVAGSEQGFVDRMNQKAKELGMTETHFQNSTGIHDNEHYSTVSDMSILLSYALKNESFREIFTSSRHSTKSSNIHPEGFTFKSSLFKGMEDPFVNNGEIIGGKTGYTDEAGLCLASLAEIKGREYIFVTTGAKGSPKTEAFHIIDAQRVYNLLGEI